MFVLFIYDHCEIQPSRNHQPFVESSVIPLPPLHHFPKMPNRFPHIPKRSVQRHEPEPQYIGRSKVSDHSSCYEGLHDGITVLVREANLAAPFGRFRR